MHYLIIGNSAAATGAIEGIRQVDKTGSITVVGDETRHVFSRPLIAHYLAGETKENEMDYRPPDFYRQHGVTTLLGRRVVGLDWQEQRVTLDNGETLSYDKLLLATGSVITFPDAPGADLEGVFDFWKFSDAQAIASYLEEHRGEPAVVLGGGLVGVQAAYALTRAGAKVTLVQRSQVLRRILDPEASRLAEQLLALDGVEVCTGKALKALRGTGGRVTAVVLDDGTELPAGLVVKATGVAPNLELVHNTPLKTGRGVLVNPFFQTNLSNVYAAGDVAETWDIAQEKTAVNANWPNAHRQGWLAGLNMAGKPVPYEGSMAMTSLVIHGVPFVSLGLTNPAGSGFEVKAKANPERYLYRKLVFKNNRLKGAILVGSIEHAGFLKELIKDQSLVGIIKDAILEEKYQFYGFLRKKRQAKVEGERIAWKESYTYPERYEKRFDEASWTERERDLRPWAGARGKEG